MCIKVEWKIFKNIGFLTIKKATVKLKNRFYSCFFAIKLASGEWQVTSGKLRKKFSLCWVLENILLETPKGVSNKGVST